MLVSKRERDLLKGQTAHSCILVCLESIASLYYIATVVARLPGSLTIIFEVSENVCACGYNVPRNYKSKERDLLRDKQP